MESPTIKEKYLHEGVVNAINHLIRNKRFIKKRIKKQTAYKRALNNQAFSLADMMEFLEACIAEITEFNDIIVRKLIDKINVISKSRLLVRFKDGTEIEQEISAGK